MTYKHFFWLKIEYKKFKNSVNNPGHVLVGAWLIDFWGNFIKKRVKTIVFFVVLSFILKFYCVIFKKWLLK